MAKAAQRISSISVRKSRKACAVARMASNISSKRIGMARLSLKMATANAYSGAGSINISGVNMAAAARHAAYRQHGVSEISISMDNHIKSETSYRDSKMAAISISCGERRRNENNGENGEKTGGKSVAQRIGISGIGEKRQRHRQCRRKRSGDGMRNNRHQKNI